MFKLMGKEINAILGSQTILIWTCVLGGDIKYIPPPKKKINKKNCQFFFLSNIRFGCVKETSQGV